MACRGCTNLQCNCFTTNSDSVTTVGNGSQYAPFTFRPRDTPFPRPFGSLYGLSNASLDAATYSLFPNTSPDIDHGGNMIVGNGTNLRATADGIYLVGMQIPLESAALDNLIDAFSIRRNGIQVSTVSYAPNSTVQPAADVIMSTVTILDLNTGDLLDVFVERVAGAGSINVDYAPSIGGFIPRLWAMWMGGQI